MFLGHNGIMFLVSVFKCLRINCHDVETLKWYSCTCVTHIHMHREERKNGRAFYQLHPFLQKEQELFGNMPDSKTGAKMYKINLNVSL